MKKVLFFFALLFLYAKFGPAIPFSTTTQVKGEPFVVQGTGKISVAPDMATISVGITQSGQLLKNVEDEVNKRQKSLINSLKELGINEADIKTTYYNISPQYDYLRGNQKITGYQVSTNYEVNIKDLDKINDAISVSTSNGANIVNSVYFTLSDSLKKDSLQKAREMAIKEAKDKAVGLAKAANITLGKILNVTEAEDSLPRPMPIFAKGDTVMTQEASQPNVQPGVTDISLNVSVSYELR